MDVNKLIQEAQYFLANGQHPDVLKKAQQIIAIDKKNPVIHRIAEQAAIELGEFGLAKQFFLSRPSDSLPDKPIARGNNPAFPPQFKVPPVIGAGNDYRHILEQADIFKASGQPYTKTVSIIVSAFAPAGLLANTLAALTHQTYPMNLVEIIVVDDGGNDSIFEVIRKYEKRLNVLYARYEQEYQQAAAYNLGMRLAKNQNIILWDAGALPPPHAVEAYMQVLHVTENVVLLGSGCDVNASAFEDDDILENSNTVLRLANTKQHQLINRQLDGKGFQSSEKASSMVNALWPFVSVDGGNLAFSRQLLSKAGFVDEAFYGGEAAAIELGYRFYNAGAYFIPMRNVICLRQRDISTKETGRTTADGVSRNANISGNTLLAHTCPAPVFRQSVLPGVLFTVPKVSIYIPAYNAASYIVGAVQSCLVQTFQDLEVVICNDGSTDNTVMLLEEHFAGEPRVRWISQRNGGIGKSTNTAIRHCRGMYIGQLDADDLLKPEAVQTCVEVLDQQNIDAVYTDYDHIDEIGQYVRDGWCSGGYSRDWMATSMVATHFRMFRKRIWNRIQGCDETIKNAVDLDLWLKIHEKGHILHIHRILYSYRWHGENTSIVHRKKQESNHLRVVQNSFARRKLDRFWQAQSSNNSLNPRELRVVPVDKPVPVKPQDVIFLIPCTADSPWQQAIRQSWAQDMPTWGFRYLFLCAEPGLDYASIRGDTLSVPCQNGQESNFTKLVLGYQFAYQNLDVTHIYMLPENSYPNLEVIAAYLLPQLAGKQYAGSEDAFFLRCDTLPILLGQVDAGENTASMTEILAEQAIQLEKLDHYECRQDVSYLTQRCTLIQGIADPAQFLRIRGGEPDTRKPVHGNGMVVFIYGADVYNSTGTHLTSVLAYAAGFIRYGYLVHYLNYQEIHTLPALLVELKQKFGRVIVHCEQGRGANYRMWEQGPSVAEALQIPFIAHIRDYSFTPWVRESLEALSPWHTLYHADKLGAEFALKQCSGQGNHHFLPHVYFDTYPEQVPAFKRHSERPIHLLYVGSYSNPTHSRRNFNGKYPGYTKLFDHIVDAALYEQARPVWELVQQVCQEQGQEVFLQDQGMFMDLLFNASFFVRWTRRSLLFRRLARYPLTLVWRGELPDSQLHPGTTLLPPANMGKTMELMSESRAMLIMLNSFTHSLSERLLSAMRRQCLTLCNRNSLIEESFMHGRDMLMYATHLDDLDEQIEQVLSHSVDTESMARSAFQRINQRYDPVRYAEQVLKDYGMPPFD